MQNFINHDKYLKAFIALQKNASITMSQDPNQLAHLKLAQQDMRENYSCVMNITKQLILQRKSIEAVDEKWLMQTFNL